MTGAGLGAAAWEGWAGQREGCDWRASEWHSGGWENWGSAWGRPAQQDAAWGQPEAFEEGLPAQQDVIHDAWQILQAGDRLLQRGRVRGARCSFERAREQLEPHLSSASRGALAGRLRAVVTALLPRLARCQREGEPPSQPPDAAEALATCEECLRLEPWCAEALSERALALRALGRLGETEAALARAREAQAAAEAAEWAAACCPEPGPAPEFAEFACTLEERDLVWEEDVVAEVQRLREEGGLSFRAGDVAAARAAYEQILALLWGQGDAWVFAESAESAEEGLSGELRLACVAALTNLAQCHLKSLPPELEKAVACCDEAPRQKLIHIHQYIFTVSN